MSVTIYVCRDGQDIGSWSEPEFRELIVRGELLPTDYYYCQGMADWKLIRDYRLTAKTTLIKIAPPPSRPAVTTALPPKTSDQGPKKKFWRFLFRS